jgi:alpha-aminoadipate carrier protein LysW
VQKCPECEVDLDELQDYELEEGEGINCPQCGTELKVVKVDPLTLTLPDEE